METHVAKTKTKTRKAITDKELGIAKTMAKKGKGVTRKQLASRLKISTNRAALILKRIKARGIVPAQPIQGANRTKLFALAS